MDVRLPFFVGGPAGELRRLLPRAGSPALTEAGI